MIDDISLMAMIFISAFLLSAFLTWILVKFLRRAGVMDNPNERSNHEIPTPRGGGIAIIGTILLSYIATYVTRTSPHESLYLVFVFPLVVVLMFLMLVSLRDDIKSLSAKWRFLAQFIAVVASLGYLNFWHYTPVLQGLFPFWLDIFLAGFIWLWFINLYNFMDGIDGLAGVETVTISIGLFAIFSISSSNGIFFFDMLLLIIAAATLGFLCFNWHPAKIFMGDVGSVPLGFLIGFFLLMAAMRGYWAAALILPAYYLADSTLTLLKRIKNRERFWEAHSQHFYQQAVRSGMSHSNVVKKITVANIILVILAVYSIDSPFIALFLAALVVSILLYILKRNCFPRA